METGSDQRQKKILGQRLKDARIASGHPNRVAACRKFGFNVNTFKAHEYGHRSFDGDEAARYAAAFGVTVERLLPGREISTSPKQTAPTVEMARTKKHQPAPDLFDGALRGAPVGTAPEDSAPSGPLGRMVRTNNGAHHGTIPIVGPSAYGIWLAASGTPLHQIVQIPPVPGHPAERQYARQVIGESLSGLYRDGDYLIFLKHEGDRVAAGHHDVVRRKGTLSESSVWTLSVGRRMISDSAATADAPDEFDIDPDDLSVSIDGIAIAVFRPIKTLA